jgi:hypothetical protein
VSNSFDFPRKDNGYPNWNNLLIDDEVYELEKDKDKSSNNTDIKYEINEDSNIITIVIPKRMVIVNWVADYDYEVFSLVESILQVELNDDEIVEGESGELQKFVFKYEKNVEEANIKLLLKNVDSADDIIHSINIHVSIAK